MRKKNAGDKEIKEWIRSSWDTNPELYDNNPVFGTASEMEAWKSFFSREFGDVKEKLKILDVGTGTGFLSLMLTEMGHDVVGVDLSEGMLSLAKKKADEKGLDIDFRIGDAESLDFEDESFNAVVSRWVLWTLLNPESAVREWRRVVKPGGWVYAFTSAMTTKEEGVGGWITRNLAMLMLSIFKRRYVYLERKPPLGFNKPNSGVDSKVKLIEKCGFEDVTASLMEEVSRILNEQKKTMPLRYKLVWSMFGDWYDWYCISGRKPLTVGTKKEGVQ